MIIILGETTNYSFLVRTGAGLGLVWLLIITEPMWFFMVLLRNIKWVSVMWEGERGQKEYPK